MIKIQNPTQGTRALDLFPGVGQARVRIHEAVVDSLMRSSVVVKIAVDADGMPQPSIPDKPEAMQAFSFERSEEALDVRITVWCPRRDPHELDTSGSQHVIESRFAEFAATIVDQVRDRVGPLGKPQKNQDFSLRRAVKKTQNFTQRTRAFDLFPGVGQARVRIHEKVIDSLMRSSVVVKISVGADRMPQATITNIPEAMQAFVFK